MLTRGLAAHSFTDGTEDPADGARHAEDAPLWGGFHGLDRGCSDRVAGQQRLAVAVENQPVVGRFDLADIAHRDGHTVRGDLPVRRVSGSDDGAGHVGDRRPVVGTSAVRGAVSKFVAPTGIEPAPPEVKTRVPSHHSTAPWTRPRPSPRPLEPRQPSGVLRARQDSNLRVTALETVALPLSYGRLPRERGGCRKGEGRLCAGDRR